MSAQLGLFDDAPLMADVFERLLPTGTNIVLADDVLPHNDAALAVISVARGDALVGVVIARGAEVWAAPLLANGQLPAAVGRWLMHAPALIGHDLKRQMHAWRRAGVQPRGVLWDVMIAAHLCGAEMHQLGLADVLAGAWKKPSAPAHADLFEQPEVDDSILPASNTPVADALALPAIKEALADEMTRLEMTRLFQEVELPLLRVLFDMECAGIALDTAHMAAMADELLERMRGLERDVFAISGHSFNIESPQQLARVLFDELKLPTDKVWKTRGGAYTTSAWGLDEMRGAHPIVPLVLEHRELAKLRGTYCLALPLALDPLDRRLHCTFNQVNTVTGRLSTTNPNLQSVPIVSAWGRRVRQAFVGADADHVIISADYSQVELRILAHIADEPALIAAFERGEDIHARTAAEVFGIPLEAVSKEQRGHAKRINFGLAYGMGANSLASSTGMTLVEARGFIKRYFKGFPKVYAWIEGCKRQAQREHFVTTVMGRRRAIGEYRNAHRATTEEKARERVSRGDRLAVNTVVQGSAADVLKAAMIVLHQRLRAEGLRTRMVLTVHDELVFDVPCDEVDAASALIRDAMCHAVPLRAPLGVDLHVGESWD